LSQEFYFIEEIQSGASGIFDTVINRVKLWSIFRKIWCFTEWW